MLFKYYRKFNLTWKHPFPYGAQHLPDLPGKAVGIGYGYQLIFNLENGQVNE